MTFADQALLRWGKPWELLVAHVPLEVNQSTWVLSLPARVSRGGGREW